MFFLSIALLNFAACSRVSTEAGNYHDHSINTMDSVSEIISMDSMPVGSGLGTETVIEDIVAENTTEGETEVGVTVYCDEGMFIVPEDDVEAFLESIKPSKEGEKETLVEELGYDELFRRSYENANEEQRKKLDELEQQDGSPFVEVKKIKMIMGEIPESTSGLTYDQVMEAIEEYKQKNLNLQSSYEIKKYFEEVFDSIAGAPDWVGGSGLDYFSYYLDDMPGVSVDIAMGVIMIYQSSGIKVLI